MVSFAQRALYGNVYNDSVGAVGIWKAGLFHTFLAVAVILTVIRHIRPSGGVTSNGPMRSGVGAGAASIEPGAI